MKDVMTDPDHVDHVGGVEVSDLISATEYLLGQPVLKASCPGGRDRAVFRMFLEDRTVIVSRRDNTKGAAREKRILEHLAPLTPHFPQLLGERAGFLFQTDMGPVSLANTMGALPKAERGDLFEQAIVSVFQYQRQIGRPVAAADVPVLFARAQDRRYFVEGPLRTAEVFGAALTGYDPAAIAAEFLPTDAYFLKWDNRFANAAVSDAGIIGWFDFEDSFLGAGYEDLAWLAADEYHALPFAEIYPSFVRRIEEVHGGAAPLVLRRFHLMSSLLIALRVRRIGRHLWKKGRWYTKQEIDRSDRVGAHPDMMQALLLRGQNFAAMEKETWALTSMYQQIHDQLLAARSE